MLTQAEAFTRMRLRFTAADVERASDEWGANCGPGAIAAICGLTFDELRAQIGDFETKGYTNPTLMWAVLRNLGVNFKTQTCTQRIDWPVYGLARIQWNGPWNRPGVPARVAYRHTHWVAAMRIEGEIEPAVFDINAIHAGGWIRLASWRNSLVPWLLERCEPKADGSWFLTHSVEIDRKTLPKPQEAA